MPRDPYGQYIVVQTTKIKEDEIKKLFASHKTINDGVKVILRQAVEYENKAVFYGEWDVEQNLRHGRGIQTWVDGSRYEGYWKNDKANIRGKLIHADGDIYEGIIYRRLIV